MTPYTDAIEDAEIITHHTAEGDVSLVPLNRIVVSTKLQVRTQTKPQTVTQYAKAMKNGAAFPPVRLARLKGALLLADGFHRVEAARLNCAGDVTAVIVDVASFEEARWLAADSNLRHGLPLKSRELHSAFCAYVRAKRHWVGRTIHRLKSYRDIAEELGGRVSYSTIRNWMGKDFPSVARAMGGNNSPITKGALRSVNAEALLVVQARSILGELEALIPVFSDPHTRWDLRATMLELASKLERAGIEEPFF